MLRNLLTPFIAFDPDERPGSGGGTETPSTTSTETPPAPTGPGNETPEFFSETFDPTTLDESLRPAYQQMRGDYTRKTQEIADQRREADAALAYFEAIQNPETREEALRLLGVNETDPEELDDELLDPNEDRLARLEQTEAQRQQAAHEAELSAQQDAYVDDALDQLEEQTGRKFSDQELDALEALAIANPDERGLPDIRGAFTRLYDGVLNEERKRWVASKQTPATPPIGKSGSLEIDFNNQEERVRGFAALAEAAAARSENT